MLDVGSYLYSKLSTDSALLALVGSTDNISASYPEEITIFPYVIFREENQPSVEYADNIPRANVSTFIIDIFVKNDSTTPIAQAIDNLFTPLYWSCVFNSDVPEPSTMTRHRVMHYIRPLYGAGDLV